MFTTLPRWFPMLGPHSDILDSPLDESAFRAGLRAMQQYENP